MKALAAFVLLITAAHVNSQYLSLQDILGDPSAREQNCEGFQLDDDDTDTSFLGDYLNVTVGTVNYTYHRFGPLAESDDSFNTSTLVLIPGSAATSSVWPADFLTALAQTREVVTFDPRGYGSVDTVPSDSYTIDDIASSLVDFFDAIDLDTPDVLGWSWGGTIALWLSAFYNDDIGSLVAVSTTSGGDGYTEGLYLMQEDDNGDDPAAALFPDTEDGNYALCRFLAYADVMPGPNVTDQDLANQNVVINRTYADNTLSEALVNITTPTLVVHGFEDIILAFDNAEYLLENINSSSLLTAEPYGHAFLLQDEDDVVPSVLEFLDYYDYQDSYYNYDDDDDDDNDYSNGYNSS